jgi:hypothetical protein
VEAGRSSTRGDDMLDEDELSGEGLGGRRSLGMSSKGLTLARRSSPGSRGPDDLAPTAPPWPWCCLHVVDLDDMLDLGDELDRRKRSHADGV